MILENSNFLLIGAMTYNRHTPAQQLAALKYSRQEVVNSKKKLCSTSVWVACCERRRE